MEIAVRYTLHIISRTPLPAVPFAVGVAGSPYNISMLIATTARHLQHTQHASGERRGSAELVLSRCYVGKTCWRALGPRVQESLANRQRWVKVCVLGTFRSPSVISF